MKATIDLAGKTANELLNIARLEMFGDFRHKGEHEHRKLGRLWGKLQGLQSMGFDILANEYGGWTAVQCAHCGKVYRFNQLAWQFRHSWQHEETN